MGKHTERVLKTNSSKPNAASHNNAIWYTDTDGFLEHSPSGGSLYHKGPTLQKIILFLSNAELFQWVLIIADFQRGISF